MVASRPEARISGPAHRLHVVHVRRRLPAPAHGVRVQERPPIPPPPRTIAALRRGASPRIILPCARRRAPRAGPDDGSPTASAAAGDGYAHLAIHHMPRAAARYPARAISPAGRSSSSCRGAIIVRSLSRRLFARRGSSNTGSPLWPDNRAPPPRCPAVHLLPAGAPSRMIPAAPQLAAGI